MGHWAIPTPWQGPDPPQQGPSSRAGGRCHSGNFPSGLALLSQHLTEVILATEQLSGFLCSSLVFFLIEGFNINSLEQLFFFRRWGGGEHQIFYSNFFSKKWKRDPHPKKMSLK